MKLLRNCVILLLFLCNVIALPLSLDNVIANNRDPSVSHSTNSNGRVLKANKKYDEDGGHHFEYADSLGKILIEDAESLTKDGSYPPDLIISGRYSYIHENGEKRYGFYITTDDEFRPIELLEEEEEEEPAVMYSPFSPDDEGEIDPNALKSLIG